MKLKKLTSYLPAHVNKYVYIGMFVVFILLLVWMKWNQNWGLKVWDKILFGWNYDVEVELSVEDRLSFESEVQKYTDLIENFVPWTGEEIDLWNGMIWTVDNSKPKADRFISKAKNQAKLWQHNDAMKTLREAKSHYEVSLSITEAFATTYDQAGAYKLAANTYQELVEIDSGKYIKNLIKAYINLGDDDKAWKLYIDYITEGGAKDLEIINGIRDLRDMEAMK